MMADAHAHACTCSCLCCAVYAHPYSRLQGRKARGIVPDMWLLSFVQRGLLEGDARWLFQQIALAVDFCHRLGIALRDIKV
jgi:hypothetical protein